MSGFAAGKEPAASASRDKRVATRVAVPLRFEPNRGQTRSEIRYVGRAAGYKLGLESQRVTFTVTTRDAREITVPMTLVGGQGHPEITGFGELPGKSNYLLGSDPKSWITDLPTFSGVRYREAYPKTDLVFHGDSNRLEYDFHVAPGGDPRKIAWRLEPNAEVRLQGGDLVVQSGGIEMRFLKPVSYQEMQGRRESVESGYRLERDAQGSVVRFEIGKYDRRRTLVIDPVLVYSTQLAALYAIGAMTTDSAGNMYVATTYAALEVAKIAPDGHTLLYDSVIGTASAGATAVTIDGAGQLYVTGYAYPGYATTSTAYQPTSGSDVHAFLTVINATGTGLVYSSYLQGTSTDRGTGIALDPTGKVLISGWTYSTDFPNTNNLTITGYQTPFVAKMDPTQSGNASLIYSAVFPSSYYGSAVAVDTDAAGNAYAVMNSYPLTVTPGAFNYPGFYSGSGGIFVVKLDGAGATQYLAYLGYGTPSGLVADDAGNVYITGHVDYSDYPATDGAYQTSYPNGFVTKLNAAGSALVYSTFLGGPNGDLWPTSIAIPAGCTSNCTPYVAGYTYANDLPTVNPIQSQFAGGSDAFIVNLTADGAGATFATYLGGSEYEDYYANDDNHIPQIGLDGSGNMYLAGNTDLYQSPFFPFTTSGVSSGIASFIVKISPAAGATVIPDRLTLSFSSQTLNVQSSPLTVNLRNLGSVAANISAITFNNSAFTQTNTCGGSIPAGGSCPMQVFFTPTAAGTAAGTLTITHDGTNSPSTVSLSGSGVDQSLLQISPTAQFLFGAQPVNTTSAPQTLTISSIGTKPALIYSVFIGGGHPEFAVSTNCPQYLNPGTSCTASITFSPYAVGQYETYVQVSTGGAITPIYYVYMSGTGTGTGTASMNPSTTALNFNDQLVSTTSSAQIVYFQNTGTIPVTLGPDSITGDFQINYDGCTGNSIAPGSQCYIYVQFTPTASGTRTGALTVQNTAGAAIVVQLSGAGSTAVPQLVFSPAALVFADQVVNTQSGDAQITVTNNGNASVTISRVYSSSADFRITYIGCSVIGQYQQCYVNLAFKPSTTGPLSGTITFVDTAAGSPQTVGVSGNGIAPSASVIPSPLSAAFDDTVVGSSSSTQTFYLFNPGNSNIPITPPVSNSADFVVTYNGCGTLTANYYCYFNVQFRPQAAGARTGTITVAHTAPGSPAVFNVSGTGLTVYNTLIASTLNAGFADTVVGQTSPYQLIYFYNPGNTNVTVSNVAVSGDFIIYSNGCGGTVYAESYCYVYVQMTPTTAGTRTGTLTLFDSAPGSPHTVSLSGVGVNPVTTLVPTPSSLGFDDQVVGTTSSTHYITLYNSGNTTINISNVSVSGDFAASGCSSIAANSYCSLPVTFTPTAAGLRTGTITLTDNASGSPHGISVNGTGLDAAKTVVVTPGSLDFGNVVTGVSATAQTVYINNTGNTSVTISSVVATAPFTVSGCLTTIAAGSACSMSVSVNTASTGAQTGSITITDNASGSPHTVSLAANGVSSTPAVAVAPNGLTFQSAVVGVNTFNLSVAFQNRSGATITVSNVAATGDFSINSNSCATVSNNTNCSVTVKFAPTASGNRTGTLTFTHNGTGGTTAINLTGFGRDATTVVQLSASALGFPNQVVGTSSASQTITLYNNGTAPLTMGTTTITGDFAITGNGCTSTVSAGSSCNVSVQFQPTTTGTRTGALTLNASDAGTPHVVQLSGEGVAPAKTLVLSATSMQYQDQTVGYTSGNQTLSVLNTGNSTVNFTSTTISGDFAITYNSCTSTLSSGGTCYVNMTFTPTASGARTGTLTLNSDATGTPHNVALSGTGVTAVKKYALTSSVFAFNDEPLNVQSGTQYAVLYNTGTAPLVLSGTTVTGDFVLSYNGCYAQTLAPESACTVGVAFKPTVTGARTGTATIDNDGQGGAAVITLSGNGIDAVHAARVSATALTFADQAVGTTSTSQYFYIYNTGNVPLVVSNIVLSGDFSSPYGYCSGYTIAVGSYCYMYVAFTPTTSGARTGAVTITDDSSTSPHTVALSGNGVTPSRRISITPGNLSFPPTATGVTSSYTAVTVTNVGNAPVQINTSTITGSDFQIYYSNCAGSQLTQGGYTCNVYVQFKPTATGALTGTLTIASDATGSPHTIPLSGTGTDPNTAVQLSQTSVTFGNQVTNTTSPASYVYLVNQGNTAVSTSTVTPAGDFLVSGCANTTIYQNGSCAMTITFKPTATGARTGSVTVTDNATGSPRTVALAGTGVVPFPIVGLVPNNLVFSDTNLGSTSAAQTIQLSNTGTATLNVTNITTGTPEFSATRGCITAISPGNSCTISVTFAPQNTGIRTDAVQITDDASGSPHTVALSGNGIAAGPTVSLSALSYGFSSQVLNTTSAAHTFTITNSGNGTLNVSNATVSGPFAISANTCVSVAPAGSCSIDVTFTPTIVGLSSGALAINDNAPGTPHQIGLSGTGLAGPSVTVSPGSLVFNSQQLNITSAAQSVTVSNTGSTATVSSVTISGPFAQTNNCTTISTNSSCTINVTFTPTTAGAQTGTLTINDDAPGSPRTVALSGNGVGQPAVTLAPPSLDFGNQNVSTTSSAQTVSLSNTGAGPLAINSVSTTGDYSVTHNCGNNLSAGASCTLTVTFHPVGANTRTGTVDIADNAPGSPQSVSLTGVGIGAVASVSPNTLGFGTVTVGTTTAAQTLTLTNTGNATLNISGISSTNAEFAQTNDCATTLAATASCTISVTFSPVAAGSRSGYIYVATDVSSQYISLSGNGTGPVGVASPSSLNFGSVTVGTPSATQTVTLSSTGTTALSISGVSISGDYSQTNTCPASLAVGSNCTIQVTFTPAAAGTRTGTLFINDNGAAGGHSISLTGSGLGPLLALNPSSLNFGTVALGTTTSAQSITVTNSGTSTVTSIAVGVATGDFAQTNNCPASLAVNATCTINVTFTPSVAGSRSGSLTVTSSAPAQSASFSGAGSGPLVQLNPSSLNFGSVVINTTSTAQNVTLTNSGNANLNISSISANGDFAETNNCPATLGINSFCTISVAFTPSTLGAQSGAVTILDDAGGSPHLVGVSGTGIVPQEDLVLTGVATPASIAPGGSTVYTFTITNNGPSVATSLSFVATLPTNAQVTSANASTGTCVTSTTITCSLANLAVNATATVTIGATATVNAALSTTGSVSAAEPDPNTANNQVTVTATVAVADLVVSTQSGDASNYVVVVINSGPANASNVSLVCDYDRFGNAGFTASQGSCAYNATTHKLSCSFGALASVTSANVNVALAAPSTGWATVSCHGSATEYDPNPVNNSAQISPEGATNTNPGDDVGVQLYDSKSGAAARVVFPSVKQPGITTLTSVAGATPPAGFRNGLAAWTYDVSTTATTIGSPMVTFAVAPTQFRHPERVRLFHMENGAWVDRTIGMDASASSVAAIAGSLSPFALFEPINHAPVASAGADRLISATSVLGAGVLLDGSASADPDGDAISYRWSGPFAEGNGVVTGARPSVTLPFGTSKVTMIASDGEADSQPVTLSITVTDFGIAAANTTLSLTRGGSVSTPVMLTAVGGAYDQQVTLGCANLPAGLTCSFSPATVQPGADGATTTLTLTSALVATHRQPAPWTFGTLLFGTAGVVLMGARRKRHVMLLLLALLALMLLVQVGCGGGGINSTSSTSGSTAAPATTVTVTVTGSSAGLSHSTTLNVTLR